MLNVQIERKEWNETETCRPLFFLLVHQTLPKLPSLTPVLFSFSGDSTPSRSNELLRLGQTPYSIPR